MCFCFQGVLNIQKSKKSKKVKLIENLIMEKKFLTLYFKELRPYLVKYPLKF